MISTFQDFVIEAEFVNELVNRVPIACGVFDVKGALVSCNENWLAFFCIDFLNNALADFYKFLPKVQPCGTATDIYVQKKFESVSETGFNKFELEIYDKEKSAQIVDMYSKMLGDNYFIACVTTASQKAVEAETMRLAAEEESKAKTRFLARM